MVLEDELVGPATALDEESESDFEEQAASSLENSDIQVDEQLRAYRAEADTMPIVEARPDEIVYKVELGAEELDEPDKGIHARPAPPPHIRRGWLQSRNIPNTTSQE